MGESTATGESVERPSAFLPDGLVEQLARDLNGRRRGLGDDPFHFPGLNFILRDSAGLAGMRLNHRRRPALQLPGSPGCDQDIAIIAVETVNQLHGIPLLLFPATSSLLSKRLQNGLEPLTNAIETPKFRSSAQFRILVSCARLPLRKQNGFQSFY